MSRNVDTWGQLNNVDERVLFNFLPVDETSLRIGSSQEQFEDDRPAKSPSGSAYGHSTSSGGGTNDATPISGKTSSARDDVGREADEQQNRDVTESNKGAAASDSTAASTSASGEKVKRLVAPRRCG